MFTNIAEVKKRSGEVVKFDPEKIDQAVRRAYKEIYGGANDALTNAVVERVVRGMEAAFVGRIPSVEDVQNGVERELMAVGQFDVAKAYIIYRYEHAKIREEKKQETIKKIEKQGLMLVKRGGTKEAFSTDKLLESLRSMLGELAT